MQSPEPPSRLAVAEGVAFLLVAVLALGFQIWLPRVLPKDGDDTAVAAVLQQEAQPGDVVLLHPWWTDRARRFLPTALPIVGYLGDENDALLDHPRIWVLAEPSLPRTPAAAFASAFLPDRTLLAPARNFGPYVLSLYRNGRAHGVRFSAAEALRGASVAVDIPGTSRTPCVREGAGFRCPGGAHVDASVHEVLYQPSRCLFIVPPGGPGVVEVVFEDVPAVATLQLQAGIVWEHAWKHGNNLTPLHATLLNAESGAALATVTVNPGTEGFVTEQAPGGPHRLLLRVQSDNAHEREACLVLRGLDGPGGAP